MQNPKVVGIVLDISLRHNKEDKRIVDIVKDQLIKFVKTFDDEDYFYVFHEDNLKTFYKRGQQVYTISKYQPSELEVDLLFALKQTLYILAGEDDDYLKFMYYITDKKVNEHFIKKVENLNVKDGYEIKIETIDLSKINPQELTNYLTGVHNGDTCGREPEIEDIFSSTN
jgi:hypothetical protein